jgi:RNA polymerase sigma-70 factor (ECF subfamily)
MNDTDREILEKLKNDNQEAFHLIFRRYFQPLFIFSKKFVDEKSAEDLVQDCFLELWQNREKIHITTSLSAYLFTILKNKCYKCLKAEKKKLNKQSEFNLKIKQEELNFFIHSENSILEFDVKDRILKTYEKLPGKCCVVFKESRQNGMSNKEIAEKLGISLKAVEKHISKALKLFREEFSDLIILIYTLLFLS